MGTVSSYVELRLDDMVLSFNRIFNLLLDKSVGAGFAS